MESFNCTLNVKPAKSDVFWKFFLRQLHFSSGVWSVIFTIGLCSGAPTVLIPQIRKEHNSTVVIDDELASWLYSTSNFVALPLVLILPAFTHMIGRKIPYLATCFLMSTIFMILYFSSTPYQILVAEAIQGFANASNICVIMVMIPEYCNPKYRSILLNIYCTCFYWGMWVANAIGAYSHWKNIAILGGICMLYSFSVAFYPESPHWLASKGKFKECEIAYRFLRGSSSESEKELRDLVKQQKEYHPLAHQGKKMNWSCFLETVKCRQFYFPLLLTLLVGVQYNFSGKFVCSIYAIDVIRKITKSDDAAISGMLILDGVTVSGMYLGCFLFKIFKIRTVYLRLTFICIASIFSLSLYLYLIRLGVIRENVTVTLCLLVTYSLLVSSGPTILTMSIFSQIVPIRYQAISFPISTFFYIASCAGLLKFSPVIFKQLGMHGTFLLYGITSSICLVLLYVYLPEIKDKTLLEIENYFKDGKDNAEGEPLRS